MDNIFNFEYLKQISLSEGEAQKRLKDEGFNEIAKSKHRSVFSIAWAVVSEPMVGLLVIGGLIYLVLGDLQEAIILLVFVFLIMGITFYQEQKTERALEALRDLSSPRALVIRDGVNKRIAGREVVRGDIIVISEGDRVPADAVLFFCNNLLVDESLLTGESMSVRKAIDGEAQEMKDNPKPYTGHAGGDDLPFLFSGTMVVKGKGLARVYAVGNETEIGKIGKSLKILEPEKTFVQKEVDKFVKIFAIFGMSLCVVAATFYGFIQNNFLQGALFGIAVAMSLLPEEFPVVLTIYLALGAWHIAKKNVLTRRIPAVEMLGSATVLCVDKTGTLTENKMSVNRMVVDGDVYDVNYNKNEPLPEKYHKLLEYTILGSQKDPFDPMEKAFQELGQNYLVSTEHLHHDWKWLKEYPLTAQFLATAHVWQAKEDHKFIIGIKGAPETILGLCKLSSVAIAEKNAEILKLAGQGLRVLGVAEAEHHGNTLPELSHDFDFKFIGFIALADPVRPAVANSLKECYHAGIRVVMITGDYPETAKSIARQIGLKNNEEVITGMELEKMSDEILNERIKATNIFARMVPEQKLRLVKILKSQKEVVAMTGDGVNDAPALKAAHIGIAMGGRGTDVARESAAMVLLDDDFSSIVKAVRSGRRVFDNLKNAMSFIISVHVPIAGLALIPLLFNLPIILSPVHIVFLEMIIDPACSLVFEAEPEDAAIMDRPPRDIHKSLFSRRFILFGVLQGVLVLSVTLLMLVYGRFVGFSEGEIITISFATLAVAYLGLIVINLTKHRKLHTIFVYKNRPLIYVFWGTLTFLGLAIYVPFFQRLFRFSSLHLKDLFLIFCAGLLNIAVFQAFKLISKRKKVFLSSLT